ncbi:MAG: hypothetical protein ABW048_10705 [Sphingobium sp.]
MIVRNSLLVAALLIGGTAPSVFAQPSGSASDQAGSRSDGKDEAKRESGQDDDGTVHRAGEIVTQPVRDVGLSKKKIPPILVSATGDPYARPSGKCSAISGELAQLNAALGPDFGQPAKKKGSKGGNIAAAGGEMVVNTFIPFRGLVREVTGAASADRRMAAAVNAGLARRGFLRGVGQARGCKLPA